MESNNLNETLEIENSEKKISENKELNSNELYRDEIGLKGIANFILVLGIISAFIIFFTIALVTIKDELYREKTILNWSGFITAITTLLFSIGVWGFLKVISNISISLKDIKNLKTR